MEEYPSATDYREIVEEFVGRDKMQTFLRDNKGFIVHADTKQKVADASRLLFYGHELTNELRKGALEYDSETKSTAFSLYSEASNEDLLSELQNAKDEERSFGDKKNLCVQNVSENDDGMEVTLEYTNKRIGRRELIAEDERETSVLIIESSEQNVRTVKQNYERIDEFNAVSSFFENWNKQRKDNDDEEVKRYNIALRRLPLQDRISLFDELLSYNPGNWILDDVLQIGIKQGEEIEEVFEDVDDEEDLKEELDDNLEGITDAVITGEGLQANAFVQKCRDNGYYFKSAKLYYDNLDVAEKVEVLIEFKEGNRRSFDISVEQGYEKVEGEVNQATHPSLVSPHTLVA
ncbi:hypothetical protein [Halosimplex salinum]|uniref:hypothetical protein n=1 Tax=Halosimplex salinum TaxID=1710538 RepID=UPI000F474935|nr:hypothetical protein [Halosimplex salinum]